MTIETMREFFGWCAVINMVFLFYWFFMILFARDFVYRMHARWFKIQPEKLDEIHYSGMAFYKAGIALFNLAPYLALRIMI